MLQISTEMYTYEETEQSNPSITEASGTAYLFTPLPRCSRDTIIAVTTHNVRTGRKIRARTKTKNADFCGHRRLRRLLFLFCSWSLTISIATCSSTNRRNKISVQSLEKLQSQMRSLLLRRHETTASFGFYYGIPRMAIESFDSNDTTEVGESDEQNEGDKISLAKRRYYDRYERIGRDVEKWAGEILREGNDEIRGVEDEDGWTEVFCAKALRHRFNGGNQRSTPIARQWIKWMKDSRGDDADPYDNQKHPCMKLIATIDAPFPIVCRYLSEKDRGLEYNSLLVDQEDLEILTPHSKICWSQTKKLLFIQPRDFVTYCRHRWLNDGTQLITNQACDHHSTAIGDYNTKQNRSRYRAFNLRGATYISRCPDFPSERTKLIMLSHCNCGQDMPEWSIRTAVSVLAPIKPFEIIHRITIGILQAREELEIAEKKESTKSTTISTPSDTVRSSRPAGMAQMGYACFWPEGGGIVDE